MANKTYLEFEGFDAAIKKLTDLQGDVKAITEKALKETHKIITEKADDAMQKQNLPAKGRYSSGKTEESIKRIADVEWAGTLASIETGFDIKNGGLASIFLMYGTPRMKKDQKLYNAFWSSKTKKEVLEVQEKIFFDEIRRLNG